MIVLNRGKWAVIFSYNRNKAETRGRGDTCGLRLGSVWLIVLQFETFIHIIHNMRKVYSCNLSNCFLALCILMHYEHIQKGWLQQTCSNPTVETLKLSIPVWSRKILYSLFLNQCLTWHFNNLSRWWILMWNLHLTYQLKLIVVHRQSMKSKG